jgi:hypothetical protein
MTLSLRKLTCETLRQLLVHKMTWWHDDIMTWLHDDMMTKWQNDKMTKWQNDKMTKWQNDKMTKWQNDKMTKWQNDKMTKWQNDKMTFRYTHLSHRLCNSAYTSCWNSSTIHLFNNIFKRGNMSLLTLLQCLCRHLNLYLRVCLHKRQKLSDSQSDVFTL